MLPFVNMSDDKENEYFSDGMTEEILNALAKVRVGTVVEENVRTAGNRIRVTA